jgi:RNA recognition motif-containing protein
MAKKLFVGNLPFAMTDAQLGEIFSAYGTVTSANVVIDKFSKRSKGFGFVEFEADEDAAKAMQALDGSEQMGRNIAVKEALPKPDRV